MRKRVTRIGAQHVIVTKKDFKETVRRLGANHVAVEYDKCGKYLVFHLPAWKEFLADAKPVALRRGGGPCDDDCDDVCKDDDECDFAAGEPPECVYVCKNGEVYLQT